MRYNKAMGIDVANVEDGLHERKMLAAWAPYLNEWVC